MDEVVIGTQGARVVLGAADRNPSDDPYAGDRFEVRLRAGELVVDRWVFMYRHDWRNLAAFFDDLASSWRGWDGAKTWVSAEHDLSISVTANARGNCDFTFEVRNGPWSAWLARVEGISVDAGEDMGSLARGIDDWALGPGIA